jgi:transcriptional regulator GlxA family with amidase domain
LPQLPGQFWQQCIEAIQITEAAGLTSSFQRLFDGVAMEQPYRSAMLRNALEGLVIETTLLLARSLAIDEPASIRPAILEAKCCIEAEFSEPLHVADLAALACMSPKHFFETFTKDIGKTPHQYLLEVRLQHAKQRLLSTDIPITQLALGVGFSSGQHLASAFKRLTGQTPSEFRQANR